MSLILYLAMASTGVLGCVHEHIYGYTSKWLLWLTGIMFVLTSCSRIDHCYDYSDLTHYVNYFLDDNDAYFEPGYVFITDAIKFLIGYYPIVLVAFIAIWGFGAYYLAEMVCSRYASSYDENFFTSYPSTFILLLILYWGCCFACEGLRNGLAIPMLLCSAAYLINEKYWQALLISVLALLFHFSALIFILGIPVLAIIKTLSKNSYIYWFGALIFLDILIGLVVAFEIPVVTDLFNLIGQFEQLSHYDNYVGEEVESYFSTQYLTYHLLGLLMLWGDFEDKSYNRAVMLYYIGLSLGTLFQTTIIVMRIQWLYLPMVVFALYYYFRNDERRLPEEKIMVIAGYGIVQSIMVLRYLGWYV